METELITLKVDDLDIGKHAVNALLREPFQKKKPETVKDRESGNALLAQLHQHRLIVRVDKAAKSKILNLTQEQFFSPDSYYIWVYQGSPMRGMLIGAAVLLVIFAGVLFPLWPPFMRQGGYYVSVGMTGLLGLLMALGVVRAILWLVLKLTLGRGGWLYPNLFADVGVIESFYPLWAYIILM